MSTNSPGAEEGTIATSSLDCPRSMLYRLLADTYCFPEQTRTEAFISGEFRQRVRALEENLGFESGYTEQLILNTSSEDFEVEFIALHEVGMGGAPCPLHSGHYTRDRMKTMEEVLRFYHYFSYTPARTVDSYPDHLTFELLFMAHLADRQYQTLADGGDSQSYLLAQRDFATRNLYSWVGRLAESIEERCKLGFAGDVAHLLAEWVAFDTHCLMRSAGQILPADREKAHE